MRPILLITVLIVGCGEPVKEAAQAQATKPEPTKRIITERKQAAAQPQELPDRIAYRAVVQAYIEEVVVVSRLTETTSDVKFLADNKRILERLFAKIPDVPKGWVKAEKSPEYLKAIKDRSEAGIRAVDIVAHYPTAERNRLAAIQEAEDEKAQLLDRLKRSRATFSPPWYNEGVKKANETITYNTELKATLEKQAKESAEYRAWVGPNIRSLCKSVAEMIQIEK